MRDSLRCIVSRKIADEGVDRSAIKLDWWNLLNCTTVCSDHPAKDINSCRDFDNKVYDYEKILRTHVGVNDHLIKSDEYFQQ